MAVHKIPIIDSNDTTASASDILQGKTAVSQRKSVTGNIPVVESQTYTPGTSNIVIPRGNYLNGDQIIQGDANLISENIKTGVSVFGVNGCATSQEITLTSNIPSISDAKISPSSTGIYTLTKNIDNFSSGSFLSVTGSLTSDLSSFLCNLKDTCGGIESINDLYELYYGDSIQKAYGKTIELDMYILNHGSPSENNCLEFTIVNGTTVRIKNKSNYEISITNIYFLEPHIRWS